MRLRQIPGPEHQVRMLLVKSSNFADAESRRAVAVDTAGALLELIEGRVIGRDDQGSTVDKERLQRMGHGVPIVQLARFVEQTERVNDLVSAQERRGELERARAELLERCQVPFALTTW